MPETLVINASPLIFLGNARRLDLLKSTGATRFMVPPKVLDEISISRHADQSTATVAELEWIEPAPPVAIPTEIVEWDLGPGESAVIATCLHLGKEARPVLDDLAARKCARVFGLHVIGTVGLVIAAHRRGDVDDPRQLLLELRSAGMWLSDAVIDQALRLAERQT